jgi:hypothetical protein
VPSATRYLCQGVDPANPNACRTTDQDPANDLTQFDVSTRTNFEGHLAYFANFGGTRNEFKGGYQRFRIRNEVNSGNIENGRMYLWYNGVSIADLGSGLTPTPGFIGSGYMYRFAAFGIGQNTNQSIYIQDKINFGKRVTLNAGVRLEKEDLPSFNNLAPPINFGWGDKIAPRLGLAIDVTGSGRTKVFASYGDFFDRLKFELPRGSFGGNFYRIDFFEIFASDGPFRTAFTPQTVLGSWNNAPGGNCPATGFIAPGARARCEFDYRIASNSPNATIFDGLVDPDLHPFQQREFTVGLQHELSRNFVLSSRFVYKNVIWAVEDAGIRNNQGSEAYIIGNPGSGLHLDVLNQLGYAKSTKPERNYKAWDISLDRRLSNNFYFNANYTWSRLFGNYSGLASSDENGRTSPGVNRFFDLPYIGFTALGNPDNGLLPTDRTHVFNAYGTYIFDWKGSKVHSTELSFYTTAQSGTPQSTLIGFITPVFLTERGDLGRSETFTQTDFNFSHKYKFGNDNRYTIAVDLNILNAFDEANVLTVQNTKSTVTTNPATFGLSEVAGSNAFVNGQLYSQINAYLATVPASGARRTRNDYGQANGFQGPRNVRFGFRFMF